MASNFTTDQLKKMLQENQDKLDSLDSSDIVASKELKKSIDKISKLLLRTEKGILKELRESNKKSQKKKDDSVDTKRQSEENKKELKNRFAEFSQKNQLNMASIKRSYIEKTEEINFKYKKDLKRAFSTLNENLHNDILVNQKVIEKYLNRFADYITEKITKVFNVAFSYLKNATLNAFSKIKGLVTSLGDKLGSVIKGTWERLKGAIFHPIDTIKNIISNSLSYVWQGIKKIGSLIKDAFIFVVKKIWEGLKYVAGLVWGFIKWGFKLMWTVLSGLGKLVFFMFKWISTFLLKVIWGTLVKITSFLLSAIWEGIKAVSSFILSIMWATIKGIAKTVFQIAFTILKSIASLVVNLIAALAPWLGILAVIGLGVYLLGYWIGWWGNKGNKETEKASVNVNGNEIKSGGFFESIGNGIMKVLGVVGDFGAWLWKKIVQGWDLLWGAIKKAWGITTTFAEWIGGVFWEYITDFWAWVTGNPNSKELKEIETLEAEIAKLEKERTENIVKDVYDQMQSNNKFDDDMEEKRNRIEEIKNKKNIFGSLSDIISKWWNEDIWPKIKKIYNDIVDGISKFIHGGTGWSSPTPDSLLGLIYNFIFGSNKINWDSPSNNSLLGKIYNLFFGTNALDWGTHLGIIGYLRKSFYGLQYFVVDSIKEYILPTFQKVLKAISDLLFVLKPEYAGAMDEASGYVSKTISTMTTTAKNQQAQNALDTVKQMQKLIPAYHEKDKGWLTSPAMKDWENKMYKFVDENKELLDYAKTNKFKDPNNFLQKAQSSFKAALSLGTRQISAFDIVYDANFIHIQGDNGIDILQRKPKQYWVTKGYNPYFTGSIDEAKGLMASNFLIGKEIDSYLKDKDKWIEAGIDNKDIKAVEKMRENIDKIMGRLNKGWTLYKKQNKGKPYIDDFLNAITEKSSLAAIGSMGPNMWLAGDWAVKPLMRAVHGDGSISSYYGLARGGIVKPQPQGVNIIAAEAGSPEVILPLNRQGLTFIDEISKRLDYTSEHQEDMVNDIVTKLTKVIKDTVNSDKKESYSTSSKQQIFLEDKSESSQLTRLLAMGMLNGR